MRRIAFLFPVFLVAVLIAVAAWSCNESEAHEPVFGAELPATNFSVNPAKDTVLKTPGGALISIPAGSLEAGDATAVSLEVKEAYTFADMTRGGLMRESGDPLSSNGMLYINVTGGQSVSIHKPLSISLPAKDAGSGLMVYKGEAGENALLNWTDAHPLGGAPAQQSSDAGKALFQTRCASCHNGKDEAAGPPLAWITKRRDRQWLYAFTRNNATLLWRGDGYSCYLFGRYKTAMPLFKDLSDADLAGLYRYIDNASRAIDSNAVADHKRSFDSCVANDPNCGAVANHPRALATTESTSADTAASSVQEITATAYYTFTVEKHGWYNVARKAGEPVAAADGFPAATDSTHATALEPFQGCPCWCNESAYRRADSLGRAKH